MGTMYSAGLEAAIQACTSMSRAPVTCVVFLSDGKPNDLHHNARREEPAIVLLRKLSAQLGDSLQFHTIGFGPDEFIWLKKMAAMVPGGRFWE